MRDKSKKCKIGGRNSLKNGRCNQCGYKEPDIQIEKILEENYLFGS